MACSMKEVMFLANDEKKHSVRWGDVAGSYMLENEGGLVETGESLFLLLARMSVVSNVIAEDFTIAYQP